MNGLPLVTGASGFAGSHLLDRLLKSHEQVAGWRRRQDTDHRYGDRVQWQSVDIYDRAGVRAALASVQPSVIFHCAGLPHVAESWKQADRALQVNAMGTHYLLEAVHDLSPSTLVVVVGSALIYRPAVRALKEDDPAGPTDPYGVSKLAQEMIALKATTPVVLARPFNHIGARQVPSFVTSSFAKQIAEIEAGFSPRVLKVGNLDAQRDMTDVRDTVRGYEALAAAARHGRPYNVCSGVAYRVGDLLEKLLSLARVSITVERDPARLRPSDNPLVLGDPAAIQADTGWRAEIPIEESLRDLLDWWRTQIMRPGV